MGIEISPPPQKLPDFGTAALADIGNAAGQIPVAPVPMSAMTTPVKATIDAITARGGPTWVAGVPSGSDFSNEASLRAGADSANASAIAAEATARGVAVTAEASTRAAAISTEQATRSAADSTLASAIANETSARQSAIAALSSQLTTDEATAAALLVAVAAITPNKASATVDFGYASGNGEGDFATTTVAAAWVSSSSRIICRCSPSDSLDHSTDETIAEGIAFEAVNIVPGTSFDVKAFAPAGTWGRHDCVILAL